MPWFWLIHVGIHDVLLTLSKSSTFKKLTIVALCIFFNREIFFKYKFISFWYVIELIIYKLCFLFSLPDAVCLIWLLYLWLIFFKRWYSRKKNKHYNYPYNILCLKSKCLRVNLIIIPDHISACMVDPRTGGEILALPPPHLPAT